MADFENVYLQRMRDYEIKDLSNQELQRVFRGSMCPFTCISAVIDLIKEGLTIDQVWRRSRTLQQFVAEIYGLEQHAIKLQNKTDLLTIKAVKQYGNIDYCFVMKQYVLDMIEAERFAKDPAWNNMGRGGDIMAIWQNRLNLKDIWKAHQEGKLSLGPLAVGIAKRIRALRCYRQQIDILEELADQFEYCSEDVEEFDCYMSELYAWGDCPIGPNPFKKTCWIATSF